MSKAKVGANVLFCGHDATFIADIYRIGNVNVVVGRRDNFEESLKRGIRKGRPTHHLLDFPKPGAWLKDRGVFVVPANQVKELK